MQASKFTFLLGKYVTEIIPFDFQIFKTACDN